eukprot:11214891-Lingulodinium_polyedra.AAC.1
MGGARVLSTTQPCNRGVPVQSTCPTLIKSETQKCSPKPYRSPVADSLRVRAILIVLTYGALR